MKTNDALKEKPRSSRMRIFKRLVISYLLAAAVCSMVVAQAWMIFMTHGDGFSFDAVLPLLGFFPFLPIISIAFAAMGIGEPSFYFGSFAFVSVFFGAFVFMNWNSSEGKT